MTTDLVLAALEAIRSDMAAMREDIQQLTRRSLSADDRREMTALLPEAHSLMGTTLWTTGELAAAARATSATADATQVINDHTTAEGGHRSLGRLLARIQGATSGGYRLRKVGSERMGCLYTVVRVSDPAKPAPPLAPSPRVGHDAYTFSGRHKP